MGEGSCVILVGAFLAFPVARKVFLAIYDRVRQGNVSLSPASRLRPLEEGMLSGRIVQVLVANY